MKILEKTTLKKLIIHKWNIYKNTNKGLVNWKWRSWKSSVGDKCAVSKKYAKPLCKMEFNIFQKRLKLTTLNFLRNIFWKWSGVLKLRTPVDCLSFFSEFNMGGSSFIFPSNNIKCLKFFLVCAGRR